MSVEQKAFTESASAWSRPSRTMTTTRDLVRQLHQQQYPFNFTDCWGDYWRPETPKGHGAVTWIGGVILVVIVGLLFAGRL